MKASKSILWLIPALLVVIALMLILRDFVYREIALPLAYSYWLADLFIKSISQTLCWVMLLVIALAVALRSLSGRQAKVESPGAESSRPRRERLDFWLVQILQVRGGYSRARFAELFGKLILEVLAHREQLPARQVERNLDEGALEAPAEVHSFLQLGRSAPFAGQMSFRERLRQAVRAFLAARTDVHRVSFERELESAVIFMEDQLEIKHD